MSSFARTFVTAGLLLSTTSLAGASENVSDGELQRFVFQSHVPIQCGDAAVSVNRMRSNPTTDPAMLHAMIRAFVDCAKSPWSTNDGPLFNTAMFAASSASLLAARHEDGLAASVDARNVVRGTQVISDYERGVDPGRSARRVNQFAPSPYITDANRIESDGKALVVALPPPADESLPPSDAVPALPAAPPPGHAAL